ncbi:MAG: hypothetical protein WC061_00525 [Melioribacteraceae bacterium]
MIINKNIFALLLVLLMNSFAIAQKTPALIKEGAPNVFIDCRCDRNFIKEQIPVVNYVSDRKDADIHILFTDQRTGSGGREYSLLFKGQNRYAEMNDTVKYTTNQTESENETRIKMADALKAGLVKYIYHSKIAGQMKIVYDESGEEVPGAGELTDEWDYWVFRTGIRTSLGAQQTSNNNSFEGSLSINRVTVESKINFYLSNQYYESNFDYEGEKIKSISRNQNFSSSFIKSIDQHFSWGVWGSANKSTYGNIKLGLSFSPGIEFNFFPYSEANQRQFYVQYRINSRYNKYDNETIFLKTEENLWSHSLHISLELIETWGNAGFGINGSNYLHNFDLYSLGANGFVSWKLAKGLSLDASGRYSKINNQITLPRGDASLEDVLLRRREIQTQYSYSFSIGLSYTFGSIYNNAINPRFD